MDWFKKLLADPYIEVVMVADNQGRLLRSSRGYSSDDDMLPSMLQALEVLGQTLADEFSSGVTQMVLLTTEKAHLLLFPLLQSTYYILLVIERSAPLASIVLTVETNLQELTVDDFMVEENPPPLNADELIEAVREWLKRRPAAS